ncbi:MAG: AAA family ATPase [Leptospira sp.]|nr:AAA family ATPase [Leptospira sp.]
MTRSFFLFGPRSTGKSTLLNEMLPESAALWIDLLDPDTERELAKSPSRLATILEGELASNRKRKWVVIDEVQKVPELLTVVHKYIQKSKFFFALTGSSARKLKRNNADLLGGRASWFELSSLSHIELGKKFDLNLVLQWGSLPEIFELSDEDRYRFLKAYANIYLKEEIVAEQLVRKVQPFRNFLELVALQNAQIINYSKFANDCGVDITTIQSYFEILIDTLIGFELQPFRLSIRKRQRTNPKFYFFDNGVTRALSNSLEIPIHPKTSEYGKQFEQYIITEIIRLAKAYDKNWKFSYLSTKEGNEIDLIIEKSPKNICAIEIKSNSIVEEIKVRTFERLASDIPNVELLFISQDKSNLKIGDVHCLYWRDAMLKIFD